MVRNDSIPIARSREPSENVSTSPSAAMRLWLAMPDWVFRVLGGSFFFGYLALQIPDYIKGLDHVGFYYQKADGTTIRLASTSILVHATLLILGLSFLLRHNPLSRAARAREIIIPLIAAFWPLLPFALETLLEWMAPAGSQLSAAYKRFMWESKMSLNAFYLGCGLIIAGNALDVWGYAVLFRSVSIVAEARELKVTGPYRFVRHPVYLGQLVAQAGVWIVLAPLHIVWIVFYLCFVAMQLYRSWLEDEVLEQAFGEEYRAWKRETPWFF